MSNEERKKINIKEFVKLGYLQEINRQFLHPLGLALSVSVYEDNKYELNSIWDYRDDLEGVYYDLKNSSQERIEKFQKNANYIQNQKEKFKQHRIDLLGNNIEDIPVNNYILIKEGGN